MFEWRETEDGWEGPCSATFVCVETSTSLLPWAHGFIRPRTGDRVPCTACKEDALFVHERRHLDSAQYGVPSYTAGAAERGEDASGVLQGARYGR